jgi:putative ABC transport system permease protein
LGTADGADRVLAEYVTPNWLHLLGVQPLFGRDFTSDEGLEGSRHVALLTWGSWQRRFGAATNVVGQDIRLNGELYRVIGVLPRSYRHPDPHRPYDEPELLTPVRFDLDQQRHSQFLRVIGRLQGGVTLSSARAELAGIARRLEQTYPDTNRGRGINLIPLRENFFGSLARPFTAALIAAGLVLLIACANIANLVLARSQGRRREFAVRSSIGASRARLARQLIIESGLLSLIGGGLGFLLVLASSGFLRTLQGRFVPAIADIRVDSSVVLFTIGICLLTAMLFGLAPLLELRRGHLRRILTEESAGAGGSQRTQRIRAGLVVAEVALSVALVIATGLLARSFLVVRQVDLGYDADRTLVLEVVAPRSRYPQPELARSFFTELTRRIQSLPGVDTVGLVSDLPLRDGDRSVNVRSDAADLTAPLRMTEVLDVTPGYLEAMRIARVAGRTFHADDQKANGVIPVVISEGLARIFWPGQSAIGRRIFEREVEPVDYTVIGVVADVLDDGLTGAKDPTIYRVPGKQFNRRWHAVVRTSIDPRALIASVRQTARELDREVPVVNIAPMSEVVRERLEPQRFAASFATVFSILALLLASLGIYGVVAYAVASRTREIGIRTVLGADASKVRQGVLVSAVKLVVPGVALGVLIGLAQSRLIGAFLYGVPAIDPLTFLAATIILPLIALLAGWLPARRAARIQPIEALRSP